MRKVEIEYTLYESGFRRTATNFWRKTCKLGWGNTNRTFLLGNKFITCDRFTRISYASLTPEKWTQYTGLTFHKRP